ncbi:hypothetical protein MAPG_03093 [Magnaporthiopsis poae ATCC 64411]|uniref:Uncharacterized protein n=1 Tax=Magnaporthiopsis poae (strain ATCC 64411 / 73-15) TaxID=644358 RepID=A0A0C4DT38_MAGP6|nr:hypothetical protein MAPG_03093 [Magnaporthiopsis poae ATCC 64411]
MSGKEGKYEYFIGARLNPSTKGYSAGASEPQDRGPLPLPHPWSQAQSGLIGRSELSSLIILLHAQDEAQSLHKMSCTSPPQGLSSDPGGYVQNVLSPDFQPAPVLAEAGVAMPSSQPSNGPRPPPPSLGKDVFVGIVDTRGGQAGEENVLVKLIIQGPSSRRGESDHMQMVGPI